MYQIALVLNDTEANLSLSYKTKVDAMTAYDALANKMVPVFRLEDDYGYIVSIAAKSISYVLFIDIERSQECNFDKDMSVNEGRMKMQARLEAMGFSPKMEQKSRIIQ